MQVAISESIQRDIVGILLIGRKKATAGVELRMGARGRVDFEKPMNRVHFMQSIALNSAVKGRKRVLRAVGGLLPA